jgi:hypothetical protein
MNRNEGVNQLNDRENPVPWTVPADKFVSIHSGAVSLLQEKSIRNSVIRKRVTIGHREMLCGSWAA